MGSWAGDAIPRDPSEAIRVELRVPGQAESTFLDVRRGFTGPITSWTHGARPTALTKTTVWITDWHGDVPRLRYDVEPA